MNEIQKKGIEEIMAAISTHNLGWIYILFIALVAVASVITWLLTTYKAKQEIKKLIAERFKLEGEVEKMKNENQKLKVETEKIISENKKIILETDKISTEQNKIRQEVSNLSLDEKLKIISISQAFEVALNKYYTNVKQFEEIFEKFVEKVEQNPNQSKDDIRKIVRFFDREIIVVFAEYFKNWKSLNRYNQDDHKDFINLYLMPFFKLCGEFLSKFKEIGIGKEELSLSQEVFRPMIDFWKKQ